MMHFIGAACMAAGPILLGLGAVRTLNHRVNELQQLVIGIEIMERELRHRLAPLPELFHRAAEQTEGRASRFFALCEHGATHLNGRSFQSVWSEAEEEAQLRLDDTDFLHLEPLGAVLGRYDSESQRQALAATKARLERQYEEAREQSKRLGKVYGTLGVTAGAFLIILLL